MAKTIVVASGKGGTGKTMFVANLGAMLSELGKKVVLIDMDAGLRNLDLYLGLENNVVYDVYDDYVVLHDYTKDTKERFVLLREILNLKPYQRMTNEAEYQLIKYAMSENMSQAARHALRNTQVSRSTVSKKIKVHKCSPLVLILYYY